MRRTNVPTRGTSPGVLFVRPILAVLIVGFVFGLSAVPAFAADVTGAITPGGSAVTVNLTSSGDVALLSWSGTEGDRVSLRITGVSLSPSGSFEFVEILKPDSSVLSGAGAVTASGWIDTVRLPSTGTYKVRVDPWSSAIGSSTLQLYGVPANVADPIALSGPPVNVSLGTPGQDASLPFPGAAGQTVRLSRSSISIPTSTVKILKEDGTVVASSGAVGTNDGSLDTTLPVTGNYSVLVDGFQQYTGR